MASDRPFRIVIAEPFSEASVKRLKEVAHVTVLESSTPDAILAAVADADALLVRNKAHVTSRIIESAPRLKVIGRASPTIDHIDLRALRRRNIQVVYSPHAGVASTAEYTLGLILALHRNIFFFDRQLRDGKFETVRAPAGRELSRKVIGFLGIDPVAERLGGMLVTCFDASIIYHDPAGQNLANVRARSVELNRFFAESDIVSIHLPASVEYRGFVNAERLAMLRPTSILVNVSRGSAVDGVALAEALGKRQISGAALDVFEREPLPSSHPLRRAPNCILTPHVGGATLDATESRFDVADDVVRVLRGESPHHAYQLS